MKKGPGRDLFDGKWMDYFQVPITTTALPVIPEVTTGAVELQLTGLTVKSPVSVMVCALFVKSLPNFSVASVMVHVSAAVPAPNAKLTISGVGLVKVGF